jgi:hypothetical protein
MRVTLINTGLLTNTAIENPRVDGSIPSQATKQKPLSSQEFSGFSLAKNPCD